MNRHLVWSGKLLSAQFPQEAQAYLLELFKLSLDTGSVHLWFFGFVYTSKETSEAVVSWRVRRDTIIGSGIKHFPAGLHEILSWFRIQNWNLCLGNLFRTIRVEGECAIGTGNETYVWAVVSSSSHWAERTSIVSTEQQHKILWFRRLGRQPHICIDCGGYRNLYLQGDGFKRGNMCVSWSSITSTVLHLVGYI